MRDESDITLADNEKNDIASNTNENENIRPHQRTADVSGPATPRQDARCVPNQNDDASENDAKSKNQESDANISENSGGDITVPGISKNGENDAITNTSPRGGKYNLRPNPNPNYSEEYRY